MTDGRGPVHIFGKRNTVNGKRFLLVKEFMSERVKEFFSMEETRKVWQTFRV